MLMNSISNNRPNVFRTKDMDEYGKFQKLTTVKPSVGLLTPIDIFLLSSSGYKIGMYIKQFKGLL